MTTIQTLRTLRERLHNMTEHLDALLRDFEVLTGSQTNAIDTIDIQGIETLTETERAIFDAIGEGLTRPELAEKFQIAPKTLDAHRVNIRKKLGIETSHKLTRIATVFHNARKET